VQLHPIDFVKYAEACGGVGFRCSRPDEVRPAIEAAIKSGRPALVEAEVDPFEAPMPAKVKPMQAIHMAEALARGEPNGSRIALTLFRDKIDDYTGR
jgi:pyruvate dehydrogenase (quinone)/pyruvate oxidase